MKWKNKIGSALLLCRFILVFTWILCNNRCALHRASIDSHYSSFSSFCSFSSGDRFQFTISVIIWICRLCIYWSPFFILSSDACVENRFDQFDIWGDCIQCHFVNYSNIKSCAKEIHKIYAHTHERVCAFERASLYTFCICECNKEKNPYFHLKIIPIASSQQENENEMRRKCAFALSQAHTNTCVFREMIDA